MPEKSIKSLVFARTETKSTGCISDLRRVFINVTNRSQSRFLKDGLGVIDRPETVLNFNILVSLKIV